MITSQLVSKSAARGELRDALPVVAHALFVSINLEDTTISSSTPLTTLVGSLTSSFHI
jgi:hypothetical protein